ncbi:MAG: AbrB/MazE/SpoVT family DNA-binding domain-containing protein [Desulfurivibrionaceae bacterium]
MQTTFRKVGNSRGILIPATFLAACGIGTEIEMRQEGRRIIIEPINHPPRLGWFDSYRADKDVDVWAGIIDTMGESVDWQW